MLRPLVSTAFAALLVGSGISLSSGAPVEPMAADAGPCITWTQEARPTGFGFRHVVILKSACKKTMSCDVSTDVNPEVQTVGVSPGETREVVTFLEAPGSGFTAKVSCK